MTTAETVAITALAINIAGIIWGAAKLSSAVDHLKETVTEIKEIVMDAQNKVHALIARVWILEEREGIEYRNEDQIDRSKS